MRTMTALILMLLLMFGLFMFATTSSSKAAYARGYAAGVAKMKEPFDTLLEANTGNELTAKSCIAALNHATEVIRDTARRQREFVCCNAADGRPRHPYTGGKDQ